jgi:hypothetical protein
MDTSILKYDPQQGSGQIKPKAGKRSMLARTQTAVQLSSEEQDLLNAAAEAHQEWIEVNNAFNYVRDELLIDYYTYRIKACEARYSYYLQLIKAKGLICAN